MPKEIRMPDLGTTESEVTLAFWFKEEGDTVKRGEPLCVVETDKATSDLESIADGVLLRRIVGEGGKVAAGDIIAYIGRAGEEISPAGEMAGHAPAERPAKHAPLASGGSVPPKPAANASPMIVNLASRAGVDLSRVVGTGPGGQITRADLLKAGEAPDGGAARQGLSKNQISVARAVTASWRQVVPISLWASVRMEKAIALRESTGAGRRAAFDSLLVYAASRVVPDFPNFRCSFEGDALVPADGVNIAVAVSGEDRLVLPVVRNADRKSLPEIDAQVRDFAARGAAGSLTTGDLGGATFAVSNLGMMPIDAFTAIIPPGQAAILTAGRIRDVAAFGADLRPVVEKTAQVVLTVDHRFINGREAARFLTRFKEAMESL